MRSVYSSRYRRLLKRLQAARLEAGLTQAAVAQAFGRPQSFVSKCESGERRIDAIELGEFAGIYGKTLGFFVAETGGPSGAELSVETPDRRPGRRRGRTRRWTRSGASPRKPGRRH